MIVRMTLIQRAKSLLPKRVASHVTGYFRVGMCGNTIPETTRVYQATFLLLGESIHGDVTVLSSTREKDEITFEFPVMTSQVAMGAIYPRSSQCAPQIRD